MKSESIELLDGEFEITCDVPTSVEEIDALLGPGGCVAEAAANLRYRNWYPRVYKAASKAIAEAGFARAVVSTRKLKDGTVRDVLESENDHLRAFLSGRPDAEGVLVPAPEGSREKLAELFGQIAPAQPLFVKGERSGFGGKVSQAALDAANTLIAKGNDAINGAVSLIEERVPGYKVGLDSEGQVTPESLARAIQALNKHIAAEAAKQSKGLLGV